MEGGGNPSVQSYRQCMNRGVGALLVENGFESCEKVALETLTELVTSFIKECGRSSRAFCELAGRTDVLGADVLLALSEMGFPPINMKEYALRIGRRTVGAPIPGNAPKQTSILHTGDKKKPPKSMGIAEGLPDFPDSHSFIRTPTHKQPQTDYEVVREKAAGQKRDVERALSRFIAKTCGKTHSLFNVDDTNLFPLISCVDNTVHAEFNTNLGIADSGDVVVPPYVNALIFRDQIFEEDEREYTAPKRVKIEDKPKTPQKERKTMIVEAKREESEEEKEEEKPVEKPKERDPSIPIDNPFLKPTKMPRKIY